MTPMQKRVLVMLAAKPDGLYYNDLYPENRKSNMPTLVSNGWAEYSVHDGCYHITEAGKSALSPTPKDKNAE